MTWRYAMTREQHDGENFFTIREVYTAVDGKLSWTVEGIAARGDDWVECATDLDLMRRAIESDLVLDLTLDPPAYVPATAFRSLLCNGCGTRAPFDAQDWRRTDGMWCPKCAWLA